MRSKKPPPVDDFIHRRCKKCERDTRTRAQKAWKCKNCGQRNVIMRVKAIKPMKTTKYKQAGLPP